MRIPRKLGQIIFDYCFVVLLRPNTFELNFFSSKITDLETVDFREERFKHLFDFDFLSGHSLINFFMSPIKNFSLNEFTFDKASAKNVFVSCDADYYDQENLHYITNFCQIEDSLDIRINNENIITPDVNVIKSLLSNCSFDSLKILKIQLPLINNDMFQNIAGCLYDFVNLREFAFIASFKQTDNRCIEFCEDLLFTVPNCLEKFHFDCQFISDTSFIYPAKTRHTNNNYFFPYLSSLTLKNFPVIDGCLANILANINRRCLESLSIAFLTIEEEYFEKIPDLLLEFRNLASIELICPREKRHILNRYTIWAFYNTVNNLNYINIDGGSDICSKGSIGKLFARCKKLRSIDIGYLCRYDLNVHAINKILLFNRTTLTSIQIRDCFIRESFLNGLRCEHLRGIEEIIFEDVVFVHIKPRIFTFKSFLCLAKGLRKLKVINSELNYDNVDFFGKFLINCENLKELDVSNNRELKMGMPKILFYLVRNYHSIETLNLSFCSIESEESEYLVQFVSQFSSLKNLNIGCNYTNGYQISSMFRNIILMRDTFESFDLQISFINEHSSRQIEWMASYFPFLKNFRNGYILRY